MARFDALFDELKDCLDDPRLQRDGRLLAWCPAHPDGQKHGRSHPHARRSLSLSRDFGLDCFAGCTEGDEGFKHVLDLLKAQRAQLSPARRQPKRAKPLPPRGEPDQIFRYVDGDGVIVAEKGRWDASLDAPKSFAFRLPGETRWAGLGGMRPETLPLYGLPLLLRADSIEPITLVEGERAAEACWAVDLLAVSSAVGSSLHDFAAFAPLAGREVWVWPDKDSPGHDYADAAGRALLALGCAVWLIENPGWLPEKGDAVDYFGDPRGSLASLSRRPFVPQPPQQEAKPKPEAPPVKVRVIQPRYEVEPPHDGRPQDFPLHALPPELARFVRETAAEFPADPAMAAVPLLGFLSGAIGNRFRLRLKRHYHASACLWTAVVGEPGSAKTPVQDAVGRAIWRQQSVDLQQYRLERRRFETALADYEAMPKREQRDSLKPEEPVAMRTVTDDFTVEKLAHLLGENPAGLVIAKDEITGLLRGMNQYKGSKGSDRSKLLEMWSHKPTLVDRMNAPVPLFVRMPFVAIVGGIQPRVLSEFAAGGSEEDGFLDRFLFAFPETGAFPWSAAEVSEQAEAAYSGLIEWILSQPLTLDPETGEPRPHLLDLEPSARAVWIARYNAHQDEIAAADFNPALRGQWKKLDAYAARLALVVHLCRLGLADTGSVPLEAESVEAGGQLVEYFKAGARSVKAMIGESPVEHQIRRALAWMRAHQTNQISLADMTRDHIVTGGGAAAEKLMAAMLDRGHGVVYPSPNGKKRVFVAAREDRWQETG